MNTEAYIALGVIWVVGTVGLYVGYWFNPILKKRGDKVEHPNRTLLRFFGNFFLAIIVSTTFYLWAGALIIISPLLWYRDKLEEYKINKQ